MKILTNINSYKLGKYIQLDEEKDFKLDSNYIRLNNKYKVEYKKTFNVNFHFTNNCNYLLFGTDSKVYKIDEEIFLNINSYEITGNYGIIRNDERLYNLYHFFDKKNVLQQWLPNSIYHIQDQYWINDTKEDLKLIDAEKGEVLWVITQPEVQKPYGYNGLTNIKKVLGIYKGNLWVQLPDSRILGLDMENGKINHEVNHFYFSSIPDGIFLDNKGKIIIFHYNIYAEFSLDSLTFMVDKNLGSEKDLIIRQVTYQSGNKNLYFTGNKDNSFEPNVYGIFDTNTQTINFLKEKEPEMGYFYQAPQVNNDLFAILDEKGNLILHKIKEML